jgi:hypothetical protein
MVLPPNGPVRNFLFAEQLTKLRVHSGIVSFPKRTEGIFLWITRIDGLNRDDSSRGQFVDKVSVAVRTSRKSFSILRFANGAEHGVAKKVYYTASSHL